MGDSKRENPHIGRLSGCFPEDYVDLEEKTQTRVHGREESLWDSVILYTSLPPMLPLLCHSGDNFCDLACLPKGEDLGGLLHTAAKESGLMGKEAEKLHQLLLNNPQVYNSTFGCTAVWRHKIKWNHDVVVTQHPTDCYNRVSFLTVHHGFPLLYWYLGKIVAPPRFLWISVVWMNKVREMPILCEQFLRSLSRWVRFRS